MKNSLTVFQNSNLLRLIKIGKINSKFLKTLCNKLMCFFLVQYLTNRAIIYTTFFFLESTLMLIVIVCFCFVISEVV